MLRDGINDPERPAREAEAGRTHERILICLVGLPKSGKTTWARRQCYPIVNTDAIRLAIHGQRYVASAEPFVWAVAHAMVKALFLAGHKHVVLDAANVIRKRRDEWKSPDWALYFHEVAATKEECIQRAINDRDDEIIDVIHRMAGRYEPLGEDETRW